MKSIYNSKWIKSPQKLEFAVAIFSKEFNAKSKIAHAQLQITALGVYEAHINGKRVGDFILAPGWTDYKTRLQFQTYDITDMISDSNAINVSVGRGWRMHANKEEWGTKELSAMDTALIASIEIEYENGEKSIIGTDGSWLVSLSKNTYSNLYNGDIYDANFEDKNLVAAVEFKYTKDIIIEQQGEKIVEVERLPVREIFVTPEGDTCIDFGQNLTGYVEFNICGKKGEEAVIYHAETLDIKGNFYTANLRSAKQEIRFICDGKPHSYKPIHSFQGFRYIRLENWSDEIKAENFTAISVHSDIKRTGFFECSDDMINKLYSNIIWSQRDNFLDVPTDCPQRDERLGWTGDAQVFARTATYNFDVEKFFDKWLADLASEQFANGRVPHIIPSLPWDAFCSSGWGDATVICPWQIYLTYDNKEILARQFDSMRKWISYIESRSVNYLWSTGSHFGDWLNLDEDKEKGISATSLNLIATAYYAYSVSLFIKAGRALGVDMIKYETLLRNIKKAYRDNFIDENGRVIGNTQTGCAMTIYFNLVENKQIVADQLNSLVEECGHLKSGFLGTSYMLHALSENGYAKTAYDMLLRREYPSWLFSVEMGATTIWEHWDGLRPDGTMWSTEMNSFNHYAYGAVADWMYGAIAGINTDENAPGFKHIIFKPITDERLSYAKAGIETKHGTVKSSWVRENGGVKYMFTVPQGCTATIILDGEAKYVQSGSYTQIVK